MLKRILIFWTKQCYGKSKRDVWTDAANTTMNLKVINIQHFFKHFNIIFFSKIKQKSAFPIWLCDRENDQTQYLEQSSVPDKNQKEKKKEKKNTLLLLLKIYVWKKYNKIII